MTDHPPREPSQIRADCARKLQPIDTGVMFTAILGALLDEDWITCYVSIRESGSSQSRHGTDGCRLTSLRLDSEA